MAKSGVTLPALKKVGIAGIKEMRDTVGHVIDKAGAEELKEVFFDAGSIFYEALQTAAPVSETGSPDFPSGSLRDAIFIGRGKPTKPNVMVGVSGHNGENYLGIWLEYGTVKMSPHPFFRPTLLATRPEMADKIANGIKQAIEDAADEAAATE